MGKQGIDKPNYTQTPNALFELMPLMKDCELRVTFAIARKTFGWHKERDRLSLSQLVALTGLSRQGVIDGIEQGIQRGTIGRAENGNSFDYFIAVKDSDQEEASQPSGPKIVNDVDQNHPKIVNVVDTQKKGLKKERNSCGAKTAPPPGEVKTPDAPVVVAAKERIRRILEDQVVLRPDVASPREAERAFVRRFSPLMAAIFGRDRSIREDKAATRDMFAFRCDADWLAERLTMLAGEAGNVYRQPAKNGKEPCAYWVRDAIEKEWSIYRKEKADADERKREQERYAAECDAAIAWAREHGVCLPGPDASVSGVHLSGSDTGAAEPAESGNTQDGIAVAAPRVVPVRGNGLDMPDVPQPSVDIGGETPRRSVREMFRDFKRSSHLASVDGGASQPASGGSP